MWPTSPKDFPEMLKQWVLLLIVKMNSREAPPPPLGRGGSGEGGIEHVEGKGCSGQEGKQGSVREEGRFPTVTSPATTATTTRTIPVTVSPNLVIGPPIATTVAPIVVSVTHPPLWLRPNSQNSALFSQKRRKALLLRKCNWTRCLIAN